MHLRRTYIPANQKYCPIVGSMLVHRLRRWPYIEATIGDCLWFVGIHGENVLLYDRLFMFNIFSEKKIIKTIFCITFKLNLKNREVMIFSSIGYNSYRVFNKKYKMYPHKPIYIWGNRTSNR